MTDEKPEARTCIVCRKTELADDQAQTCTGCLNKARIALMAIVDGFAILPDHMHTYSTRSPGTGEGGSRNAETPLTGGDVLAILAPGSDGRTQTIRISNGLPCDWDADELPSDPQSAVHVLASWEDDWRKTRSIQAASSHATIVNTSSYLHENLTWASQHHDLFDEFAADIRKLRGRIDHSLGRSDNPEYANVECYCGGDLARAYGHHGLEDDWRCEKCKRTYQDAEFYQVYRHNLLNRAENAARYLSVDEIAQLLGLTPVGVRQIIRRKGIKYRDKDSQAKLYDWADFRRVGYDFTNNDVTFRPEDSA